MNTEKEGKGFCQSSLKPWLWVLAVLVCLTVIWVIWGGQHNAARRGVRDRSEIEMPWGKSTAGAASTNTNAQLMMAPLPLGAARTITPPHGDRGRCNNCHPVAGTSPLGTGISPSGNGTWQQAQGTSQNSTVLNVQEAFADAAIRIKRSVVNIVVARGSGNASVPGMQFANPSGELVNGPGTWCPLPYSQQAAMQSPVNGLTPYCPMIPGQMCPVHGQMCPRISQTSPQAQVTQFCPLPGFGQMCPIHGQMCPRISQTSPQAQVTQFCPLPGFGQMCPIHSQACPRLSQPTPQFPAAVGQQVPQPIASDGIGSGIIVDERGYVLTNNHVVSGATSITVSVPGYRGVRYTGQVVRTDAETDLALVKLMADSQFPAATLGDSNTIQVGDFVLAVGSPFGLEHTVTSGIVSDTDRTLNIAGQTYMDLIQTDASINRGNSGGPLVNMHGEVVGINTAIYSPTEGFTGVGFAIPINHAREILRGVTGPTEVANARAVLAAQMAQLLAAGPEASWLGIDAQVVDQVIGKQLKVPNNKGILVNNVLEGSPALAAGIQRGDVIIVCDNQRLKDVAQLRDILAGKKAGDSLSIQLVRNGKRKKLKVAGLAVRPDNLPTANTPPPQNAIEAEWLGMDITSLTLANRKSLSIPKTVTGAVVVTEVEGVAAIAGIQAGDVIKGVNGQSIEVPSDILTAINNTDPLQGVMLDISRNGNPMYITVN